MRPGGGAHQDCSGGVLHTTEGGTGVRLNLLCGGGAGHY